ncbi:DUF4381 domain-containing protein [Legionella londiniensis]|uniref:DUF4381 domain-containing protein n=1 Tax=Legionella londiniensis TaxID=45068 RepID=A0A0W0VID3_9GAMM|nr:DUF4381 domain-containing protein [Legionella londiniensis]KTD19803.1 hypothetical protein Llon_1975 [Legionella londiniensis]STX92286.1 Uncharacterised protein [Legionella londiniensis]
MANSEALTHLRDIHLPPPVGWWPLAPGWYVLALILLLMLFFFLICLYRAYCYGQAKRQALKLLAKYKKLHQEEQNSQLTSARISELLRRVALVYYPRSQVASLKGDDWLSFLQSTAKQVDFNEVREELLILPYQARQERDLEGLFKAAEIWIRQRRKPCLN